MKIDNEKEDQEELEEEGQAVFNMAIDTLRRLGKILEEIKQLSFKTEYPINVIQSVKIGLVRQFFVQASPLLPNEDVEKYKDEVLKLVSKIINVEEERGLNDNKSLGTKLIFDEELEKRMDEILIELQLILQKERYFMPTGEDEGDF